MKVAFAIFLFAASALCQQKTRFGQPGALPSPAACGPAETSFKVKLDDSQHDLVPPEDGKVRIYFIHEAGLPFTRLTLGYPTLKFAVDGVWTGADHGDSWFSASLDPGEHHLCATLQSSLVDHRVELKRFVAEAGKSYYYRTRLVLSGAVELLELEPIDSEQGEYLISRYPFSISKPKK
jgi:hypothetical protein